MGIGSSFAYIGALVVASRWFDKKYFPIFIGITQLLASIGAIAERYHLQSGASVWWRDLMWTLMIVGFVLGGIYILFLEITQGMNLLTEILMNIQS